MKKIYVYHVMNHKEMDEMISFAEHNGIEIDMYRKKEIHFRVPAGCCHSMFMLRYGTNVQLIDTTWEVDLAH
jgi:hypothetical protein